MDIDYRRWWALGVDLLSTHPTSDPVLVIAAELSAQLGARGVAVLDVGRPVAVRPLGSACRDPVDIAWYATRAEVMPFVVALRGADRRPIATTACCAPPEVPARTRADGLDAVVALPLPGAGAATWLVVLRAAPFRAEELELVEDVHRLLQGIQCAVGEHRAGRGGVLTARERSVLELMAEGLVADAIGRRLGVSRRTVSKHQEHIYRKLAATDRLSAVLRAQEAGLLAANA